LRRFRVVVNGLAYEVEVEELGGEVATTAARPAPREVPPPPVETVVPPIAAQPRAPAAADGVEVSAPLPGTVLAVKVAEGQEVDEGQVLIILEAMKMENEIMAPQPGRVVRVAVERGQAVNVGDVLVVLA
jgi:biotin carboxyl carrier protein